MKNVNLYSMTSNYTVESETIANVAIVYEDGYHTLFLRNDEDNIAAIYYEEDQEYNDTPTDEVREIVEYFKKSLNIK